MEDDNSLDLSKTYIYQGEEYILTGRSATKDAEAAPPPRRARKSSRRARAAEIPDVMIEITPAPRKSLRGAVVAPSITKELQWVKASDLYVVVDVIAEDYWDGNEEENESTDSSS